MTKSKLIPSFGRRKGRTHSKEKNELLDGLLTELSVKLPEDTGMISPCDLFPVDSKEMWLDIGFGSGENMIYQVKSNKDVSIIGSEVYTHGIAALLKSVRNDKFLKDHVRIYPDDIRILLDYMKPESIDRVFILFPDPWPKKKHHKRRLIQHGFLTKLAGIMKEGAMLHIATDYHEYAAWILVHMFESGQFRWTACCKSDWVTPPEHHMETRYQKKNKAGTDYPIFLNLTKLSKGKR